MTMHYLPGDLRRIAVIGCSGSGKSTLSRLLGGVTGLPVIHLDREHWQPGWTEPPRDAWAARVAALAERPEWIIDGQYGAQLRDRLIRADLAIFLDLPTPICLSRVVRRTIGGHGRVRPDMGEGCPERFDLEFLRYVASFRRRQRPNILRLLDETGVRTVWLRSRREQASFIRALQGSGLTAALRSAPRWPQPIGFSSTTI